MIDIMASVPHIPPQLESLDFDLNAEGYNIQQRALEHDQNGVWAMQHTVFGWYRIYRDGENKNLFATSPEAEILGGLIEKLYDTEVATGRCEPGRPAEIQGRKSLAGRPNIYTICALDGLFYMSYYREGSMFAKPRGLAPFFYRYWENIYVDCETAEYAGLPVAKLQRCIQRLSLLGEPPLFFAEKYATSREVDQATKKLRKAAALHWERVRTP